MRKWFIHQFVNASMSYLETIFKINYIYVHLTCSTRTKCHERFFHHTNRVYKVALIIIVDETLHADVNKLNIYFLIIQWATKQCFVKKTQICNRDDDITTNAQLMLRKNRVWFAWMFWNEKSFAFLNFKIAWRYIDHRHIFV